MPTSQLSTSDLKFLQRRRTLNRLWPFGGALLLLGWSVGFGLLYQAHPVLINPFDIAQRLAESPETDTTIALLAGVAPVLGLALFMVVIAFIAVLFGYHFQEKRLLRILDKTCAPPSRGDGTEGLAPKDLPSGASD
jgi:hypothetical protein